MALAFTNLGASANPDINSGVDATSYVNSSWVPPTTGIIILFVYSREATAPNEPTVTGNSLTWTSIASYINGLHRITLFSSIATSATTGATTIDFGAQVQLGCATSFFQITGADSSGGIASTFIQTPTGTGTGTTGTVTFAAAAASGNRPIVCFLHVLEEVTTERANWVELDDLSGGNPQRGFETQYRDDAFETTATATWATSVAWRGLGAEIKAEVAGTVVKDIISIGLVPFLR